MIRVLTLIFGFVAVILLGVAAWLLISLEQFKANAQRAEGQVVRIEREGRAYAIVQFKDGDKTVEIRSRIGSSPPAFSVGEKVAVMYQPGEAEDARIESFSEQYLLPVIFGSIGGVFLLVASLLVVIPALGRRRRRIALEMGTPVKAKVIEIRLNTSLRVNGKSPWVIVAEFREEGRSYTFTSHNLWTNPEAYYPVGSEVTVFYLPEKPRIHAFQLDKLPEEV